MIPPVSPEETVMTTTRPTGWIKPTEDTTWPDPADPLEVEWKLRYGTPGRVDLLWAAAVISAYKHLMESATTTGAQQ